MSEFDYVALINAVNDSDVCSLGFVVILYILSKRDLMPGNTTV